MSDSETIRGHRMTDEEAMLREHAEELRIDEQIASIEENIRAIRECSGCTNEVPKVPVCQEFIVTVTYYFIHQSCQYVVKATDPEDCLRKFKSCMMEGDCAGCECWRELTHGVHVNFEDFKKVHGTTWELRTLDRFSSRLSIAIVTIKKDVNVQPVGLIIHQLEELSLL